MTAAVLIWSGLCESPAPANTNAPAVATRFVPQKWYESCVWIVRHTWNWLPLNWGIPFSLVAAIGGDLGRFAALDMIQSKQARGLGYAHIYLL
jgi:hypothetical protein